MRQKIIIGSLLFVYFATFIFLFVKLRSMSGTVLEELNDKNIYYILGIMFIAGISASLYMILEANNKRYSLSMQQESESISFDTVTLEKKEEAEEVVTSENKINGEIDLIFSRPGTLREKLDKVIAKLSGHYEVSQALIYAKEKGRDQLTLQATYAFIMNENDTRYIVPNEGLTGQAIMDQKPYYVKDIPEGYLKVISGLGESLPKSLIIIPCTHQGSVAVVFELSSLKEYPVNVFNEIVSVCNHVSELINQ